MKIIFLVASLALAAQLSESTVRMSVLDPAITLEQLHAHSEVKEFINALLSGKGELDDSQQGRLYKYSFDNCRKPSEEIVVPSNVVIHPDPIRLPGNITASGHLVIKEPFGSPVRTVLTMEKHTIFGWIKVPCISGIGSCTYEDLCKKVHPTTCPPIFQKLHLNCKCPFTAGNWTVPPTAIYVSGSVPVSGGLKIRADLSYKNKPLTCVDVQMTLA